MAQCATCGCTYTVTPTCGCRPGKFPVGSGRAPIGLSEATEVWLRDMGFMREITPKIGGDPVCVLDLERLAACLAALAPGATTGGALFQALDDLKDQVAPAAATLEALCAEMADPQNAQALADFIAKISAADANTTNVSLSFDDATDTLTLTDSDGNAVQAVVTGLLSGLSIQEGDNVTITGAGTPGNPMTISADDTTYTYAVVGGELVVTEFQNGIQIGATTLALDTDTVWVPSVGASVGGGVDLTWTLTDQVTGDPVGPTVQATCLQQRLFDAKGSAIPKDRRVLTFRFIDSTLDNADPLVTSGIVPNAAPDPAMYNAYFDLGTASFYGCDNQDPPGWLSQDRGDLSCYTVGETVGGVVIDAADTTTWPNANFPYILATTGGAISAVVLGNPSVATNVKTVAGGGSVDKADLVAIDRLRLNCVKVRDATGAVESVGVSVLNSAPGQSVADVLYRTKVGYNPWSLYVAVGGGTVAVADDPIVGEWPTQFLVVIDTPCGQIQLESEICYPDHNPYAALVSDGFSVGSVGACVLINPIASGDGFYYEGQPGTDGQPVGFTQVSLTNDSPCPLRGELEWVEGLSIRTVGIDGRDLMFTIHSMAGRIEDVPEMEARHTRSTTNWFPELGVQQPGGANTASGDRIRDDSKTVIIHGSNGFGLIRLGHTTFLNQTKVQMDAGETKDWVTRLRVDTRFLSPDITWTNEIRAHRRTEMWVCLEAPEMALMANY